MKMDALHENGVFAWKWDPCMKMGALHENGSLFRPIYICVYGFGIETVYRPI